MGVDGPGIFDNDGCGDFLGNICGQLLETIREDLKFENGYYERPTTAAVSVLVGILKHIDIARAFVDSPEITDFRDRYLQWFDANINVWGGEPEFMQEVRGIVVQEFNTLIALCLGE
jgi:hypothetical protein